jgi:uncharacterized membrane protein
MDSRAKLFGHPIHQMLIVFPLGLLGTSVLFDLLYFATSNGRWADIGFWMITAGIIGGLAAAVFGAVDWWAIPRGTRAWAIGLWHGLGNVVVVALFAIGWILRFDAPTQPPGYSLLFSLLGIGLALVTGWLGGELVDRLGVGVDQGAHLNAPSSLSGRPAHENAQNISPAEIPAQRASGPIVS